MSFGFGVGDFIAVGELAWNLYRYCYVVARGAPHEFQLLLQEITTLSQSIKLLQLEADDPNSTLVRAGEDRVRMVKEMMNRVEVTLRELEKHAKKYDKLGDSSRSKRKQMWDKFRWSVDASDLDALRNKLVYHNGVINLLLTSCGNSSLQRIESSNMRLEKRFSQIGDLVQKFAAKGSSEPPAISTINNRAFKTTLLSAALMKNAEVGQRRWSAIGVDEWIGSGRWWLLKSQSDISGKLSSGEMVSKQGYTNLIKASWILIDVIARHPQLNLLDPGIRYDAEVLAEAIRNQLEDMDNSGCLKPSFEDIQACDLSIWEAQTKGATLQPAKRTPRGGLAEDSYHYWETEDEQVIFQRFVHYQASPSGASIPCIILFVAHKLDKRGRIFLRDQSWNTLATFIVGGELPDRSNEVLSLGEQKIMSTTTQDAQYLCIMWEAVEEYVLHCVRKENEHDTLQALLLLFAVRNGYQDLLKRLLRGIQILDADISPSLTTSVRLRQAATELASQEFAKHNDGSEEYSRGPRRGSLLVWAAKRSYKTVAILLLEQKGTLIGDQDFWQLTSLHEAARQGCVEVVRVLLSESRVDKNGYDYVERCTALGAAASKGHEVVVDELLKVRADVNAPAANDEGLTALQAAAKGGHNVIVDKLLKARANVNAPASRDGGLTALQAAAQGGHDVIVDKLLKAGADVNAPGADFGGLAALQVAAIGGHDVIVDKLLKAGADVNTPGSWDRGLMALQAAAKGGHDVIVDKLLKAGADVNAPGAESRGLTALQAAAKGGHDVIVDKLLKAGADVNAPGSWDRGLTALLAAAEGGHDVIVDKLLKAGASFDVR